MKNHYSITQPWISQHQHTDPRGSTNHQLGTTDLDSNSVHANVQMSYVITLSLKLWFVLSRAISRTASHLEYSDSARR